MTNNLVNKVTSFTEEVNPKKSVHVTLIASNGYKCNEYSDVVQNLSVDHLKMGLIRSGNTDLMPMDDDKLTDYLWPIVDDIIKHGSDVEQRQEADSNCIPEWIKTGNRLFIEGFGKAGEKIILIDDDYNAVIDELLM